MIHGSSHRRAFTLIELLVTVSVIALLISILLPSLRAARNSARRTVCANNIRTIWQGVLTYTFDYRDRIPFIEDVNVADPAADPFNEQYPTAVGVVLKQYVQAGTWVCPSAVAGFPAAPGQRYWKMTYTLWAAGPIGEGIPYDDHPHARTHSFQDPAIANEVHFDGRPLQMLDGRRYIPVAGYNKNEKGFWNAVNPIFAEALGGNPSAGMPEYPHRTTVQTRLDLQNARKDFETITGGSGVKPAYHELHAVGDKVSVYTTRALMLHRPGF